MQKAIRAIKTKAQCAHAAYSAPADTRYVNVLDGLRTLAIFVVAWFHYFQQSWMFPNVKIFGQTISLEFLVRTGYMGVDIMLLLSGFLLFLPYARYIVSGESKPSLRGFYLRRLFRILPSYYLCVLLVFFCDALPGAKYPDMQSALTDLVSHLTFTHIFSVKTYLGTPLNGVLWTLAVEVQAYLLFPLMAKAFCKKPVLTYGVMVAAALAFRGYVAEVRQEDLGMWINQLPAFLDVYAQGALAALLYVNLATRLKQDRYTRLMFTAIALLMFVCLGEIFRQQLQAQFVDYRTGQLGQLQRRFVFSACGAVLMISLAFSASGLRALLGNRVMRVLAGVSFQYYMWHQYLAVQFRNWGIPFSESPMPHMAGDKSWQWRYTLLCFFCPLLLALLLTYLFERPINRWATRRFIRRERLSIKEENQHERS